MVICRCHINTAPGNLCSPLPTDPLLTVYTLSPQMSPYTHTRRLYKSKLYGRESRLYSLPTVESLIYKGKRPKPR